MLPFDDDFPKCDDLKAVHVYVNNDCESEELLKEDLIMSALLSRFCTP